MRFRLDREINRIICPFWTKLVDVDLCDLRFGLFDEDFVEEGFHSLFREDMSALLVR